MTYLLDVNVLVALVDSTHIRHDDAHAWFAAEGSRSWATCPITENGLLRIMGHAKYINSAGSPAALVPVLRRLREQSGHVFWPEDFSLIDEPLIDAGALLTSAQVTDSYLLAMAARRGGQLASFDRRLSTKAIRGGAAALHLIGAS